MRACKAVGTLVIPLWKSSYFWFLLCDDGKHWNAFVHNWVILPKFGHLFVRGKAKNHVFGSKDLSFNSVVALRQNFVQPRAQSVLCFCTVEDDNCSLCNNFYNYGLWYPSLETSLVPIFGDVFGYFVHSRSLGMSFLSWFRHLPALVIGVFLYF